MVYNDGDQLVRWPGMYRYSYDDAGNLVQVRNDSQTQVLKSYTYTPAGLLATATFRDKDGNTRTLSNVWDADSNRVGMNANGTAYVFVYDTTAGIPAVIEESTSGSTAYCVREPGGSLIARLNATDGIRYYHFDELGSTRLLTDGSGNVTDKYAYDAYGSLLAHDRSAGSVSQPYQYVGQLGYYAHYMEPDFGLLQLGVRFYDAEVGRFTQRDPARRGLSSYAFLAGNPTARVDPLGLDWSTKDFVWHYYFGGGAAVDLADVGLLDDFQNARQTKNNVLSFRIQVRDRARKRAKEKCKGHSGLFRLGMGYYTSAMNHVGDERVSNPLYSVGGSKLFMSASCDLYVDCCKRVVVFYCMNTYSINDMFSDPYSGGFELGVAVPYDITAFWQEELAGHARF
jgi:RHS repeat-associated protein